MALPPGTVTRDTMIGLKITYNDTVRKIRLPLRDLDILTLPAKLRTALGIRAHEKVLFERYSDSAGGYIVLDRTQPAVYKALTRAAKAKGKLRLRASLIEKPPRPQEETPAAPVVEQQATTAGESQDFTSVQPRMTGTGIFDYRATHIPQQSSAQDEAPVPQPFATEVKESLNEMAAVPNVHNRALCTRTTTSCPAFQQAAWSVYCNVCDVAMSDVHYHCSICDGGDYDLCENCVNSGKLCHSEDHWLIKRFIREGKVVTSVTERVGRKFQKEAIEVKTMPGGFIEDPKPAAAKASLPEPTRTCNSCVVVMPEHEFITCNDCDDYDLCITCHTNNTHGHNPRHTFQPARAGAVLPLMAHTLLKAGRNVAHNAICDMCDKKIFGIRHKCLSCPDWDVCNDCQPRASILHPNHRLAAISEPLPEPQHNNARHFGIYCDGILCRTQRNQSYIVGDRYKCAVCNDTDFCASCEASPIGNHNRTHPLIKFRTPVRNVSITTTNEDVRGHVRKMGDKKQRPVHTAEADTSGTTAEDVAPSLVQPASANTATAVQTVAEIPPTVEEPVAIHTIQPKDGDVIATAVAPPSPAMVPTTVPSTLLTAAFVRDSVPDGTVVLPGSTFTQIWTLRNEGPYVWPAGCSVRYVGGDNMLNVDNFRPASVSDLAKATESSVVSREVQVGEEASFRVILRAPVRQGKSISYWRLKAADGTPFGHRLWCDIEVRSHAISVAPAEKLITGPSEPTFSSSFETHHPRDVYQARIQAMHETQLRLLQHQRMLQHRQLGRSDYRSVSAPLQSMPMPMPMPPARDNQPASDEASTVRVENARARVEALKTKIMRQRAEEATKTHPLLAKFADMHLSPSTSTTPKPEPENESTPEAEKRDEPEVTAAPAPAPTAEEVEAELGASSTSSSQMIFPKLEKESPASSIISAKPAYVQAETGQVEQSAALNATALEPEQEEDLPASPAADDFDDLEVVSAGIVSDDEEDDGFLTDEEYDILDASDRETVASP